MLKPFNLTEYKQSIMMKEVTVSDRYCDQIASRIAKDIPEGASEKDIIKLIGDAVEEDNKSEYGDKRSSNGGYTWKIVTRSIMNDPDFISDVLGELK